MNAEPLASVIPPVVAEAQGDACAPPRWWYRRLLAVRELLCHAQRRWYLYLPILAIWGFAYTRLFFDPTPRVPVVFNWTPSLPYRVAVMKYGQAPLRRGDLIVFSFDGLAQQHFHGLRGQPFLKLVRGLPGDVVTVQDRVVHVNGEPVGFAKTHAHDRYPLAPISPLVIPDGHYYVQGTSPDSFDSRYSASGLVRAEQVLGVALPIF
jgi:conjugal transfer pilin signal peptidase TrbI